MTHFRQLQSLLASVLMVATALLLFCPAKAEAQRGYLQPITLEVHAAVAFPVGETVAFIDRWRRGLSIGGAVSRHIVGSLSVRVRGQVSSFPADEAWANSLTDPTSSRVDGGDRTLLGGFVDALIRIDGMRIFAGGGLIKHTEKAFVFHFADQTFEGFGRSEKAWSVHFGFGYEFTPSFAMEASLQRTAPLNTATHPLRSVFTFIPLTFVLLY